MQESKKEVNVKQRSMFGSEEAQIIGSTGEGKMRGGYGAAQAGTEQQKHVVSMLSSESW